MPDALDPVPLLKHLHAHGVEHIIIGGLAVSAHGHVRPSKDLDIVPDPAHENLERLVSALADANALEGIPVRVCGLDALRAMKRAAGRPQDIEDLRRLGED
jgi:predicted nucleotidyltransferase